MAVDNQNMLKILFPQGVPENFQENEEVNEYLSALGNSSIEHVNNEPDRLQDQKSQLLEETQELAFSNYKTFIETAECSREIFKKFNSTETKLDSLISNLPVFNNKCQELSKVASEVDANKRMNCLVSSKSNQLLDILELPQLMENCIKNGCFEEALELTSYVRRMGRKHRDIPVIASIVKDFEASWVIMLQQLLSELRTDLQLPKCLQIVGYLRRMEIFSEAELKLKFLQARDSWFQELLASIPQADANQHIQKTIELSRIHLFSMVTQYRAIFSDEESVMPTSRNVSVNETSIFYSWITEKISQFISNLERQDMAKNLTASLESVVGQCMYFGLSFSRVGADFRALLAPKFIKIIEQNLEHKIRKANKTFEHDMDTFILKKITPVTKPRMGQDVKPEQPPTCLLEFYPLANYTNGVLAAFNELRVCAPLTIADFVTKQIQDSLKFCSKIILNYYRQEEQAFSQVEKDNFTRFCGAFQVLVSYLQKCIHLIFPLQMLANHLGILVHQVQNDGLTFLNENVILENLSHLMPVEIVIPELQSDTSNEHAKLGEEIKLPL